MKRNITFLTVSAIFTLSILQLNVNAQTSWRWAANAGNSTEGNGNSVAVDSKGNVYVTGSYTTSSITFGTFTLINANPDLNAVFIAKYNASGTAMWANSAGGGDDCYGLSVGVDDADNVYVSGYFRCATITFGSYTLNNTGATSGNSFLVKYDSSGNVLWAKNPGVTGDPTSDAFAEITANSGYIYGAGQFQANTITFGSYTLTNTDDTYQDVMVVKYDTSGNVKWSENSGGTDGNDDVALGVAANSSGEVAVTGVYASSYITFGSTNLVNANEGLDAVFVVKYDSLGNALWANSAGGDNDDYGLCVGIDNAGNVYASGYFKSPSITFGSYTLINTGEPAGNIFLVKYSPSGNVLWAINPATTGSITSDAFSAMSVNATGIYLSGQFQAATIKFGSTTTLTNTDPTYQDILLVKYDTTGNVIWAKNIGGTDGYNDDAVGISANNKGNVGVTGFYATSYVTFGSTNIVNSNEGSNDIFIADMYDSTAVTGIPTVAGNDDKISIYPNPNDGNFTIQLQNINQNTQIEIFNVLGENVYTAPLNSVNTQINLSDHPAGLYLYRISTSGGQLISNGKFVVE